MEIFFFILFNFFFIFRFKMSEVQTRFENNANKTVFCAMKSLCQSLDHDDLKQRLWERMSEFGPLKEIRISPKGCGFIVYMTEEGASNAINKTCIFLESKRVPLAAYKLKERGVKRKESESPQLVSCLKKSSVVVNEDEVKVWMYKDLTQKEHGPFNLKQLVRWYTKFPANFQVYRENNKIDISLDSLVRSAVIFKPYEKLEVTLRQKLEFLLNAENEENKILNFELSKNIAKLFILKLEDKNKKLNERIISPCAEDDEIKTFLSPLLLMKIYAEAFLELSKHIK